MAYDGLNLDHSAQAIKAEFYSRLPKTPRCGDTKKLEFTLPREDAVRYRNIQFNPHQQAKILAFDIDDRPAFTAAHDADLPDPNLVMLNPDSETGHLIYFLASPVTFGTKSYTKPIQYLDAIDDAMTIRLGADPYYSGFSVKNPLSPHWRVISNHAFQFELGTLADYLDLSARGKRERLPGIGSRNVTLFDDLRQIAYRMKRPSAYEQWQLALYERAMILNTFDPPLPICDVRATTRSVARWVWRRDTSGWQDNYNRGRDGHGKTRHDNEFDRFTGKSNVEGIDLLAPEIKRDRQSQAGRNSRAQVAAYKRQGFETVYSAWGKMRDQSTVEQPSVRELVEIGKKSKIELSVGYVHKRLVALKAAA